MLNWTRQFNIFCLLDNQQYAGAIQRHELLLAAGASSFLSGSNAGWSELDAFLQGGWSFGHLSYELHSLMGPVSAPHRADPVDFPPFFFFRPQVLIRASAENLSIEADDPEAVFRSLMAERSPDAVEVPGLELSGRWSRGEYLALIDTLRAHIRRGDCYEINFCQEFFAEGARVDPHSLFRRLAAVSPNPFTAFYRLDDRYLLCASPERFLARQGKTLISQPIKGTAGRSADPAADALLKAALAASAKDRAENVMVVDLVRNDLSRVCREGTVEVAELFGVYTYPQVHQMISTVQGELRPEVSFSEILKATFPMGSMTGAPKKKVMELIDRYERSARGIFSGSVGYVAPSGDFDFNVVIRSLMYHAARAYLSYQVGSGITWYSDGAAEWEECQLKAAAIKKVLTG
ncbi:MAG TPA: anthranilate synthase component I family protein [Chitinophagaceae bacterium]|jgi:para-aminobenzoate synthetase component 1|nr:anthranilate synthase component I family protein [Chitinophagaceae bacterium]